MEWSSTVRMFVCVEAHFPVLSVCFHILQILKEDTEETFIMRKNLGTLEVGFLWEEQKKKNAAFTTEYCNLARTEFCLKVKWPRLERTCVHVPGYLFSIYFQIYPVKFKNRGEAYTTQVCMTLRHAIDQSWSVLASWNEACCATSFQLKWGWKNIIIGKGTVKEKFVFSHNFPLLKIYQRILAGAVLSPVTQFTFAHICAVSEVLTRSSVLARMWAAWLDFNCRWEERKLVCHIFVIKLFWRKTMVEG